jgi:hypothetical protein
VYDISNTRLFNFKTENLTICLISLSVCNSGQYLGKHGCTNCEADHYGAGGWLESCTKCPDGKGVEAGKGKIESDCASSKFYYVFYSYKLMNAINL